MVWKSLRWLAALALAALGTLASYGGLYLWRRRRARLERTVLAHLSLEGPRRLRRELISGDEQLPGDGSGPLLFRRYRADIAAAKCAPELLMDYIQSHIRDFSPATLAEFIKVRGDIGRLKVGDEFEISIFGPWNGMVRVVDVEPTSFTFITLSGHPEAGQIRFQIGPHPGDVGLLRFEICSWARSRDGLVHLAYYGLGLGKEIQTNVWAEFCERVVEISGGTLVAPINVLTEEVPFKGEVIVRG